MAKLWLSQAGALLHVKLLPLGMLPLLLPLGMLLLLPSGK
jgi:hypothetical protein